MGVVTQPLGLWLSRSSNSAAADDNDRLGCAVSYSNKQFGDEGPLFQQQQRERAACRFAVTA